LGSSRRNVLIIGGSGGLGIELARIFLKNGDRVAIHFFRNERRIEAFLKEIGRTTEADEAFPCHADIRNEKMVEEMFRQIRKKWPNLDLLINSGGVTDDMFFSKMSEPEWNEAVQVNLSGLFFCMKQAALWMIPVKKGHLINIASRGGLTGRIGQANYASSKAGVIGLTKSAALEWGPDQIQVNAVLPGFLPTRIGLKMNSCQQKEMILENALQRASTLDEVSRFVFFLSRMENVSGQIFNLDSRIV
jgi:3-oxoacyl-[acyl-carrier protein] reductase